MLVATLWMLAIISLAAAYFAEQAGNAVRIARERSESAEALRAFANTRAEVIFRLATVPLTRFGVGDSPPIALDDRAYRGVDGDIVRLQDNRGLINLNFHDPEIMRRLLSVIGVPPERRQRLMDTLQDYIDDDNLRRLHGAEAQDYEAATRPRPPNDYLVSPHQLRSVMGWREETVLWEKDRILGLASVARVNGFNPNTAPLEVLAALPGSDLKVAKVIQDKRALAPLYDLAQLPLAATGVPMDPEYFLFMPGNSIRITHYKARMPWSIRYSVTLTPLSDRAPWRIDYYARNAVSYVLENEDKIPELPAGPGAQAGRERAL